MDELSRYWYSRWLFERGLAAIYLIGFLVVVNQFVPLLGERGLLPVSRFVREVPFRVTPASSICSPPIARSGSRAGSASRFPSWRSRTCRSG
jgi:hypothetical protein